MASYYILLDSNILIKDYKLAGKSFKILLNGLSKIDGLVIIPQIVFDEVIGKYEEELKNKINKAKTAIDQLKGHLINKPSLSISPKNLLTDINDYKKYLNRQIDINRMSKIKYPKTEHSDIVQRCLNRRKPFKKNDSGYRDYLIWLNVLQIAKKYSSKNIVFITNNLYDFYDDNNLHPDLIKDLIKENFNLDQFGIYTNIDDFNNETIFPLLNALDNIRDELNQGKYKPFNLEKWVNNNFLVLLESENRKEELKEVGFGFPEECGTILDFQIESIDKILVDDVNEFSKSELFISLTVTSTIMIDIDIDSDWNRNSDILEQLGYSYDPFISTPSDFENTFYIEISLFIDKDTGEVISSEINHIDSDIYTHENSIYDDF